MRQKRTRRTRDIRRSLEAPALVKLLVGEVGAQCVPFFVPPLGHAAGGIRRGHRRVAVNTCRLPIGFKCTTHAVSAVAECPCSELRAWWLRPALSCHKTRCRWVPKVTRIPVPSAQKYMIVGGANISSSRARCCSLQNKGSRGMSMSGHTLVLRLVVETFFSVCGHRSVGRFCLTRRGDS